MGFNPYCATLIAINIKVTAMPKKDSASTTHKRSRKSTVRRAKIAKRKAYFTYLLTALFVVGFLVGFGYYLGLKSVAVHRGELSSAKLEKIFQGVSVQKTQAIKYDEAGFGLEGMIEKLRKHKAEEERKKNKPKPPEQKPQPIPKSSKRPKLVLIIDDVSSARQIKAIKALGYPVTPSIFPPSGLSSKSNRLSYGLMHFMIHLPMQSGSVKMNRMQGMLKVTDSNRKMQARAREIRKLFPTGRFINNHTGSVFTSNYKAMKKMYGYLRAEGFTFVDSRTAGSTKLKRITREYGDRYIVRDVFIDNTQTVSYIHKQLAKAVRIAKRRGYAIAIGHPHKATFKALASAKKLFRGVDLVYIDELY